MSTNFTTRVTLIAFAIALIADCSSHRDPQAEIVGTWEFNFTKSMQQTYAKDGSYRVVVTPGGPSDAGTWSMDSNRLTMILLGQKQQITVTILKLDDSALVYEATNKAGKVVTTKWSRIK
jgi:uncharacterized protein (TIGR03066 family)